MILFLLIADYLLESYLIYLKLLDYVGSLPKISVVIADSSLRRCLIFLYAGLFILF